MDDVVINSQCNVIIDHHEVITNMIKELDVKTFGKLEVVTDRDALTTIEGERLTVRSGAKVSTLYTSTVAYTSMSLCVSGLCLLAAMHIDHMKSSVTLY